MNFFKYYTLLLLSIVCSLAQAQVSVKVDQKRVSDTEIDVIFSAAIEDGWHVYGIDNKEDGPTSASFNIDASKGIKLRGALKQGKGLIKHFDEMFDMDVTYFEHRAVFTQRLLLTEPDYTLQGYFTYGACNDQNCLPPTTVDVTVKGTDGPIGKDTSAAIAKKTKEIEAASTQSEVPIANADSNLAIASPAIEKSEVDGWYKPVVDQLAAFGESGGSKNRSIFYIFLMGIVGGFIALLTPCVWPIIPMTVSFFLHRSDDRKKAIRSAIIYGVSIVVIYVSLGVLITGLFGANALNDLSTDATFNILFFLMLVVFAASFFGGFEITLPSSWTNSVDAKASETSGLLSIFLMAFTLTLVSFSCTGPIIGFLLVEVSTGGGSVLAPTIGMLGFAIALALPFTLFALFPSWLKKAPKSGGWMNTIKVVLGFIELAFAFKFLSVADLAYGWHILDREVFLAIWISIFLLLAFYLFGWIIFPHDDDTRRISVSRFFIGLSSMAFAIYMIPGLWGAPCKAVSAFAPPLSTQDFNLDPVKIEPAFTDYEVGMAYAKQIGKPVLIDFTGHGCVNCRKMELAVWHDPKVRDLLMKDYVLISLYVDEKQNLPEPIEIEEGGTKRKLRTVGDKWSYLQRRKFGTNSQPFYVPIDNEGNALNHSFAFKEDIPGYIKFLRTGLDNYRENAQK